ncbi:DUF1254 domain-containing protein [Novosphingobium aquae]|uniref:DUF1254 domain-containing protein n=1 Tax=Novosphingobium aquae TaxID=3133435 RepID=A0ABU8S5Z7_9SPHN
MKRSLRMRASIGGIIATLGTPCAASTESISLVVTPTNFARAETDGYFASAIARGGLGRFSHMRELASPDRPLVIRPNRDTLYSTAVFDLDAGPVTISLPDAGARYFSLTVIDQNHHIPLIRHGAGRYRIDRKSVGTRYAMVGLRIFVDPTRASDLAVVRQLQDAVTVDQPKGPGHFDRIDWDKVSLDKVRKALLALGETLPDLDRAFGKAREVDPVAHLVGTAMAWGGLPRNEATYLNVTPAQNDGSTVYRIRVGRVPVNAFWSITVYDHNGKLISNSMQSYSLNNLSAVPASDQSVTVQFGGCEKQLANCLPVTPGWNYMVRLYRPRKEILDDRWIFPAATRVTP